MKLSEGIIVKSLKYQENSKIITILNEESLSTYYVKGGASFKSRNFSYSNELTKIGFDFNQKAKDSLKILTTGTIINNYSNIKQSFEKLNDCFLIMESINYLGDHINDFSTLYQFLDDILKIIDERVYSSYYLIIFRLKLLYLLGVGPVFSKCVNCTSPNNLVGFVFEHGGMYCSECSTLGMQYISKALTESLRFLYITKLENLSYEVIDGLEYNTNLISKFLDNYYEHFLGFKSRANTVIEKMKNNSF